MSDISTNIRFSTFLTRKLSLKPLNPIRVSKDNKAPWEATILEIAAKVDVFQK